MKLRLKDIRKAKGVTLDELASRVGMSKSYGSEIENEKKDVNGRRLSAFAVALGVSTHDLIDEPGVILSSDFLHHIDILRSLSPEDRAEVERLARYLASRQTDK